MHPHQTTARRASLLLAALLLASLTVRCAFGAGNETVLQGEDLVVTVNWRWAGCGNGGYYPVRVRVVNRGKPRVLTFQLEPPGGHSPVPRVARTLAVDQNATSEFSLSIPMVGSGTYAGLKVYQDGEELENLGRVSINVPEVTWGSVERPALLVIAPTEVDCSAFETAVTSLVFGSGSAPHAHGYGSRRTEDHQVVPPSLLPDSWIDYSGLDLVAITLDTLEKLPQQNRSAILKWVQQGGNLIVYQVGAAAQESTALNQMLELPVSAARTEWQLAKLEERFEMPIWRTDEHGNITREDGNVAEKEKPAPPDGTRPSGLLDRLSASVGRGLPEAFAFRDVMLGRVIAFKGNPFPGSPRDWGWLMRSIGQDHFQWTQRHGTSARQGNEEFLKFLIPGIRSVPAYSFLILISVFAIVIGPLNYFFLKRRRCLYLLVLTIPLIALATSASLFAYSVVAHGFAIKSRVRSVTVIDQGSRTAVTTARVSLYAGLAPSEGLRFSPETAVYPLWHPDQAFEYGAVDWTRSQALTSGWLRSRTRTQFVTVAHRAERGRLEIDKPVQDRLPVSNGFEWDLEALIVADDQGALYFGDNIPAGASAELMPASPETLTAAVALLNRSRLEVPSGVAGGSTGFFPMGRPRHYYYRHGGGSSRPSFQATNGLAERRIVQLGLLPVNRTLPSRTYFAILRYNPAVEIGVPETTEINHLHVVMGYY